MNYYQGYDDGMYQTRTTRSIGLVGFLFRLFFSLVWGAFVYIPLLMIGFWISEQMKDLYSNDLLIKISLTLLIAYLVFGMIYFAKGILIALRASGKVVWILIWIICVVITCGFQFFFVQYNVELFLANRNVANYQLWSWLGASLIALMIYSHYKFLTNIAPGAVFPFFQAGFKTAMSLQQTSKAKDLPQRSRSILQNVPMQVS